MAAKRTASIGKPAKAPAPEAARSAYPAKDLRQAEAIDPRMLELLVCPLTKGSLHFDAATHSLVSRKAKLAYPIRDGIPIMLPSEARPLDD